MYQCIGLSNILGPTEHPILVLAYIAVTVSSLLSHLKKCNMSEVEHLSVK